MTTPFPTYVGALPAAAVIAGADQVYLLQGGVSKTALISQITVAGNPGGALNSVQYNNGGVFGGYTNTQLTTLINAFTAALSGAVPASGGGTLNFLRADGSWALPPGAPAGVPGSVQFDNAGVLGGDGGFTYTAGGAAVLTTSLRSPLLIGGTGPTSSLLLESTSGFGTSDFIGFRTGSQVEYLRLDTWGQLNFENGGTIGGPFTSLATSAIVTISIGNPAIISFTAHGFVAGQVVRFTTTGALPAPIVVGTDFYVLADTNLTDNTFTISTRPAGIPVDTTGGAQAGVQTCTGQLTPNYGVPVITIGRSGLTGGQRDPAVTINQTWNNAVGLNNGALVVAVTNAVAGAPSNQDLIQQWTYTGLVNGVGGTHYLMGLDARGRLEINLGGIGNTPVVGSVTGKVTVATDGNLYWGGEWCGFGANGFGTAFAFTNTRGGDQLSHTALQANDGLSGIICYGSDGTNYIDSAQFICAVDTGGVAPGHVPSYFEFQTSGASITHKCRFRIDGIGSLHHSPGSNGPSGTTISQTWDVSGLTELTTIASAASTNTAIQIPAGSVVFGVSVRVVTVIPTAATFTVTAGATTFSTAAVSTAATSTDPGTAAGAIYFAGATAITITPNLVPAAATGQVRVTIHYYTITPPTS